MGIAILSGILSSLEEAKSETDSSATSAPSRLPNRFIACVRRPESAARIESALSKYKSHSVEILVNDNSKGVAEADIVLLGCKPQMFRDVLDSLEVREGWHAGAAPLDGKYLISILAGVPAGQIKSHLYPGAPRPQGKGPRSRRCRVISAIPNTASMVRESMTVIADSTPPLEDDEAKLIEWIFTRIGKVVKLPPSALDASTALCGSGPAFMALVLEAVADGTFTLAPAPIAASKHCPKHSLRLCY